MQTKRTNSSGFQPRKKGLIAGLADKAAGDGAAAMMAGSGSIARMADGGARRVMASMPQSQPYANGSQNGGRVVGKGGPVDDTVPAAYSPGEYVLPADTAAAVGHDNLDQLRAATHMPAAMQRKGVIRRMADGGGSYPYSAPDKDIYAGAGKPSSAPENTPAVVASLAGGGRGFVNPAPAAAAPSAPSTFGKSLGNSFGVLGSMARGVPGLGMASTAMQGTASTPSAQPSPTPTTQDPGWRTNAVVGGAADDAKAAWSKGNAAQAMGSAARGVITAIPTAIGEFGGAAATSLAGSVKGFWNGLTGGGGDSAPAPATPGAIGRMARAAAPAPVPATQTDAQRGGAAATMATPLSAGPTPAPGPIASLNGQVTRSGNSYSGGNVSGDITVNGQPGGGGYSSMNAGPISALAARSQGGDPSSQAQQPGMTAQQQMGNYTPAQSTGGFGLLDKGYQDKRNAGFELTSITASPQQKQAALNALNNLDAASLQQGRDAAETMRNNVTQAGATQRTGMTETGATARTGMTETGANYRAGLGNNIAQGELGIKQSEANLSNASKANLINVQNAYIAASRAGDTKAQETARAQMMALTGNVPPPAFEPLNETNKDSLGNMTAKPVGAFNKYTGVQIPFQQGSQGTPNAPVTKDEYNKLPKGATYTAPDGRVLIKG